MELMGGRIGRHFSTLFEAIRLIPWFGVLSFKSSMNPLRL